MQSFPPRQQAATPALNPASAAYVPNSYQQSFGSNSSYQSQNAGSMGDLSRTGSMDSTTSYQPSQMGPGFHETGGWVPNAGQENYQRGNYQGDGYLANAYPANNYHGNSFQAGAIPNNYNNYNPQGGVAGGPQYDAFGMQVRGYGVTQGEYNNQYGGIQPYPQSVASPGLNYGAPRVMTPVTNQAQAHSYNSRPNNQMNNTYGNMQLNAPFNMTTPNQQEHAGRYEAFNRSAAEQEQMRAPFPYPSHPSYANVEYAGLNNGNRSMSSNSNYSTDRVKAYAKEFGKGKGKGKAKQKSTRGSTKTGQQTGGSGAIAMLNETLKNLKLKNSNSGGPVQPSGQNAKYNEGSEGSNFDTHSEISELKQVALVPFLSKGGEVSCLLRF